MYRPNVYRCRYHKQVLKHITLLPYDSKLPYCHTVLTVLLVQNIVNSGVARIWCEERHETKRKQFKGYAQKYYEIHAINSDKGLNIFTP